MWDIVLIKYVAGIDKDHSRLCNLVSPDLIEEDWPVTRPT